MKVETECSCGATLLVEWRDDATRLNSNRLAIEARSDRLLAEFRRDHKLCRVSAAAKEAS